EPGHFDIHENHVGLLLQRLSNHLLAGCSLTDHFDASYHVQDRAYTFTIEGVIIGNYETDGFHTCSSFTTSSSFARGRETLTCVPPVGLVWTLHLPPSSSARSPDTSGAIPCHYQ